MKKSALISAQLGQGRACHFDLVPQAGFALEKSYLAHSLKNPSTAFGMAGEVGCMTFYPCVSAFICGLISDFSLHTVVKNLKNDLLKKLYNTARSNVDISTLY